MSAHTPRKHWKNEAYKKNLALTVGPSIEAMARYAIPVPSLRCIAHGVWCCHHCDPYLDAAIYRVFDIGTPCRRIQ